MTQVSWSLRRTHTRVASGSEIRVWTAQTSPLTHQKTATPDFEPKRFGGSIDPFFRLDTHDADKTKR
jgi:hypothetical protein